MTLSRPTWIFAQKVDLVQQENDKLCQIEFRYFYPDFDYFDQREFQQILLYLDFDCFDQRESRSARYCSPPRRDNVGVSKSMTPA